MIIKSFELRKLSTSSSKLILLYGNNEGFKSQVIQDFFLSNFSGHIDRLEENEILSNSNQFLERLMSKSFFEEEKIILINRVSDKIMNLVDKLINIISDDIRIIINAGSLEKRSKLRIFFEKNDKTICIPFYEDSLETLSTIAAKYFKSKKIQFSQEMINLLVERCSGDRINLTNELEKISNFTCDKKKISLDELIKLTNLAENYSVGELVDNCLSKNKKRTNKILNENNFSTDDCILIIRSMLTKVKRILRLKNDLELGGNIDQVISSFKPPIFWKDKNIVKNQLLNWSTNEAENLIYKINSVELLIKKNTENSLNIVSDFLLRTSNKVNN